MFFLLFSQFTLWILLTVLSPHLPEMQKACITFLLWLTSASVSWKVCIYPAAHRATVWFGPNLRWAFRLSNRSGPSEDANPSASSVTLCLRVIQAVLFLCVKQRIRVARLSASSSDVRWMQGKQKGMEVERKPSEPLPLQNKMKHESCSTSN